MADKVGKCEITFPATPDEVKDLRKTPAPLSEKEGKRWFLSRMGDKAKLLVQFELLPKKVDIKNAKEVQHLLKVSTDDILEKHGPPLVGSLFRGRAVYPAHEKGDDALKWEEDITFFKKYLGRSFRFVDVAFNNSHEVQIILTRTTIYRIHISAQSEDYEKTKEVTDFRKSFKITD